MRQLAVETVLSLAVYSVHILQILEVLAELALHHILVLNCLLQLLCRLS